MSVRAFHVMTKPAGPICNLDCKYCFYLEKEKLYPQAHSWIMREEVLESYIRQYIEQQDTDDVHFAWQGGEPTLLKVEYFRRVVALQRKYAHGKRITNALQTNGTLLDDEWGRFLREHGFLVGVSIDGPAALHDAYRVDKGGKPTFDNVLRGIEVLQRNDVAFNTLTTVHRKNSRHPLEVYRFLKGIGSRYLQFIPIVERLSAQAGAGELALVSPTSRLSARVTPWSVEPREFGKFLCTIFDEWVRHDVGGTFVQLFDVSLQMWVGEEASLCIFRRNCGSAMALEHNGDLYSCDHFVYPENRLGNIMENPLGEMARSAQQVQFGTDKESSLPEYCRECEVRFACNGECPKHRFMKTPDGEPGLNYLCSGYKMFFRHIDPYMRFMADELTHARAPANIMSALRERERGSGHPGRNDPCPCGSGLKFKRCCGGSAAQPDR